MGRSIAPVAVASAIAKPEMHTSCRSPSVPIPAILPASSCRARIDDRRISTTRDAFSSITPVATQTP